jgi:hypothetical protein
MAAPTCSARRRSPPRSSWCGAGRDLRIGAGPISTYRQHAAWRGLTSPRTRRSSNHRSRVQEVASQLRREQSLPFTPTPRTLETLRADQASRRSASEHTPRRRRTAAGRCRAAAVQVRPLLLLTFLALLALLALLGHANHLALWLGRGPPRQRSVDQAVNIPLTGTHCR